MTAPATIDDFVAAEELTTGDALMTARLARLTGETAPLPLLALAFAVRAVRHGSTCFDPRQDPEVPGLAWPDPRAWLDAGRSSRLGRVLLVEHDLLYLDRYRELEVALCDDLAARAAATPPPLDEERLVADLDRLFPGADHLDQRAAAERAARVGTIVLTGGPGTGKTTTVAGGSPRRRGRRWRTSRGCSRRCGPTRGSSSSATPTSSPRSRPARCSTTWWPAGPTSTSSGSSAAIASGRASAAWPRPPAPATPTLPSPC